MSARMPSRRFREIQLLIGAALVMLVVVNVAQLQLLTGTPVAAGWRWGAAALTLAAAGAAGLVAWLLLGRAMAPYRELLAEAARISQQPAEEAEDRFLIATFRAAVQRLESSEAQLRQRADELSVLADVLTREAGSGVVILAADGVVRAANSVARLLAGAGLVAGLEAPQTLSGEGSRRFGDRQVEVHRFPLLSMAGEVQGEVLFLTDRTEVASLERALREREGLATLGELAAGMAHELRNALTTIRGYLRLLGEAAEGQRERYREAIDAEARELGALLERFLGFAQPPTLRRETVDLLALAVEVGSRVRAAFPGLSLGLEGAAEKVAGDPLALSVTLENLVRNAAEAVAGAGGHVRVALAAAAESVSVRVEDDGPGVALELSERLFAPFVSSKPSGGLGLAVARRLARLHGGEIEYERRLEGGSRFVLTLPRAGVA
jgi:two-component system sensor histidine kinase FlrB